MSLEICPSCGITDSITLMHSSTIRLNGKLCGGRLPAFCTRFTCDQRYTFYPKTGRITQRHRGLTLKEWRQVEAEALRV